MRKLRASSFARFLMVAGLFAGVGGAALAGDDLVQWRGDYNGARKDAQAKGLPLVVVVGSENCIYCRKQDATTFRDPLLAELLNKQACAVKIDGNREPAFVQAMKIEIYPTTIIAAPDGKIVSFLQGYVTAEQLRDHVRAASVNAVTTPDWATRDHAEAEKALRLGDAARAIALWKNITGGVSESALRTKAEQGIAGVEKLAADRLARGQRLEANRELASAIEVYSDLIRNYSGTRSALEATGKLTAFAARGEGVDRQRVLVAKEFVTAAREDFRRERFAECLDRCEQIQAQFPELPEGREAVAIRESIHAEPERLTLALEQIQIRASEMHLLLAQSWIAKGQLEKATVCLERAVQLAPNSRTAELASLRLVGLKKPPVPAMTTSFAKPVQGLPPGP